MLQAEPKSPRKLGLALQRPKASASHRQAASHFPLLRFPRTKLNQNLTKLKNNLINTFHSPQAPQILKTQSYASLISKFTIATSRHQNSAETSQNIKVKSLEFHTFNGNSISRQPLHLLSFLSLNLWPEFPKVPIKSSLCTIGQKLKPETEEATKSYLK